jgi:hypothetical protein
MLGGDGVLSNSITISDRGVFRTIRSVFRTFGNAKKFNNRPGKFLLNTRAVTRMGKTPKQSADMTATELCATNPPSEARQLGRRLILRFTGKDKPELDRIEFQWKQNTPPSFWQRGNAANNFGWTEVPQALALVILDYVCATPPTSAEHFSLRGPRRDCLAASLGDAIYQPKHRIHELFVEHLTPGGVVSRVQSVFDGDNIHGKQNRERRIHVNAEFLPQDCIEVFWEVRGPAALSKPVEFQTLSQRIRKSLGLPITAPEIEILEEPDSPPTSPNPPASTSTSVATKPAEPLPPTQANLVLPPTLLNSFEKMADAASRFFSRKSEPSHTQSPPEPSKEPEHQKPASSPASPPPKLPSPSAVTIPAIDSNLFAIHNPQQLEWFDDMPFLDLGDDEGSELDIWRLKDACEGVLILGAPGSGKTSGSGYLFSRTFLAAGFGGLVLCAKTDEAQRWKSLCERFGRADDCIVINRETHYCLNALAYETQRPGKRIGLTDDLISFFRVLMTIVTKRSGAQQGEDFWVNSTNQLMRALFDVFLLANEPLVIDSLNRFVAAAPSSKNANWHQIPFFSDLLLRAEQGAKSEEDKRILRECWEYWTVVYPGIAPQTRSGISLGFTAMANALSGRGIHDLISSVTNITPEVILSGKIVILDLSLKDCGQGGLLVQAAWKYLFQRAIERRSDKGESTARPVFLWEDEGHLFFSQHDIDFQPTARDCRAAHVIISQNLHNFYQLGHNPHAVQAVFATMNTQIFHANGDLETNQWASDKIGTE